MTISRFQKLFFMALTISFTPILTVCSDAALSSQDTQLTNIMEQVIANGNLEQLRSLLSDGLNPNTKWKYVKDPTTEKPLLQPDPEGGLELLQILVRRRVIKGSSAFTNGAERSLSIYTTNSQRFSTETDSIKMLLQYGAHLRTTDAFRKDSLDYATSSCWTDLVQVLENENIARSARVAKALETYTELPTTLNDLIVKHIVGDDKLSKVKKRIELIEYFEEKAKELE